MGKRALPLCLTAAGCLLPTPPHTKIRGLCGRFFSPGEPPLAVRKEPDRGGVFYMPEHLMIDEHRGLRHRTVQRIVLAQFGLAGFLGAGFWLFGGGQAGYSALIGGLISAIASWVFARFVFAGEQTSSDRFLRRVLLGELLKLGVVVIMFGVVLTAWDLAFLPLISAFAVTLLTYWVTLLFA